MDFFKKKIKITYFYIVPFCIASAYFMCCPHCTLAAWPTRMKHHLDKWNFTTEKQQHLKMLYLKPRTETLLNTMELRARPHFQMLTTGKIHAGRYFAKATWSPDVLGFS